MNEVKISAKQTTVEPLLTLDGVEKVYSNGFRAVAPLNLSIYPGEFLTLLGPSGCGKTTTLRMIGGFEAPTAGRISLMGSDITAMPPSRRSVNTVFQDYALFPHLTVEQNVGFGPSVSGAAKADIRARVAEILSVVGLAQFKSRLPSQLSGGQRQRVALARALIQKPRILLLDEPLGALDANIRGQMQSELKDIQARIGITFIMVTHDQQEAMTMSDRIAIMNGGRVMQLGSPRELYDEPQNEFVANFLGTTNLVDGHLILMPDGRYEVACGAFKLQVQTPSAPVGPVRISFRPERILAVESADGPNVVSGVVQKQIFLGNLARIYVDVPDAGNLIIELSIRDCPSVTAGQSLNLLIPPQAIRLFLI